MFDFHLLNTEKFYIGEYETPMLKDESQCIIHVHKSFFKYWREKTSTLMINIKITAWQKKIERRRRKLNKKTMTSDWRRDER